MNKQNKNEPEKIEQEKSEQIIIDPNEKISYAWHAKIVEDIKAQTRYTSDTQTAYHKDTVFKLWIIIIILFSAFVLSNLGWLIYESQFSKEEYSYELSQDSGEGGDNTYTNNRIIIGGDYHGEAEDKGDSKAPGDQEQQGDEELP